SVQRRVGRNVTAGSGGLLLGLVALGLQVDGLEVDRCQHQGGEAALGDQRIDHFTPVGEEDVRAGDAQYLFECLAFDAGNVEHASLGDFDQEDGLLVLLHFSGKAQYDVEEGAFDATRAAVDV